MIRRLSPVIVMAGVSLMGIVVCSVLAPWIAPQDPVEINLDSKFARPSWLDNRGTRFLLGADNLGRDMLSRCMWGGRISLTIAIMAMMGAGLVGVSWGLVAGSLSGLPAALMMRVVDAMLAVPRLLVAVTIVAFMGATARNLILVMIVTGWMSYARIVYGCTLSIKERDYVLAARALGCGHLRVTLRHILPNVASPTLVVASFSLAQMMLMETALDFLGLGIQPPAISWGVMLADSRNYLTVAWWPAVFPGLFIVICVLAVNLTGDWLRDVLDPRLRVL